MGTNGRQYIVEKLSRGQTAQNYISVLEELLGQEDVPRVAAA